jgi:hypothetical protein
MRDKRQIIPAAGLLATCAAAGYMVVQLSGQASPATGDFTNAAVAEVRDAQGQVILMGRFQLVEDENDDVERKAAFAPTGGVGGATGEAEVEFSKAAPAEQEIEFSVRNLPAGAVLTFLIDGAAVATVTTDTRGRAEAELDVRMPGTTAAR